MADVRVCRSVLFTPGMRGDRIEKAVRGGAADVVVADLEDAVAPEDKSAARDVVKEAVGAVRDAEVSRWVRVNTWASGLARADLEVVMAARPDAIVVPKVESPVDLELVGVLLDRLERRHGIPSGSTGLVPIIESARGVLQVPRLLAASGRVAAVAFGAEDLAADAALRRSRGNQEVLYARSRVALAAAAARVRAIDQVFVDLDDVDGIGREAREARALGYRGKMVLHPKQVAPVHDAFSPSPEEVADAKRLVSAVDEAGAAAGGVLRFEGRMIDVPLIEQARRLLAEAHAIEDRDASSGR